MLPRKCPKWLQPLPAYKTYKAKAWSFAIVAWYRFPLLQVTPGHDGRASSGILPSVFQRLSARSQLPHNLILILVQFKLDGLSQGGRRRLSANAKMPSILSSDAYLLIYDKKRNFCAHYQNLWTLLSEYGQREAVLHWKLNKSFIKSQYRDKVLISRQNSVC